MQILVSAYWNSSLPRILLAKALATVASYGLLEVHFQLKKQAGNYLYFCSTFHRKPDTDG